MKLTTKTGLSFISLSTIFFLIGSVFMYFAVRVILAEDLSSRLHQMQSNFIDDLQGINDIARYSNKHVFIEKPITDNVDHAKDIIQLSRKNNIIGQVGHVERFNPAYVAAFNHIKDPMFIESHRLSDFNPRGTDVSVIMDLMIHDIDIVLNTVKSKVKKINASGVSIISNSPDIANARIEFENKCVANLTASRISLKKMRKTRIFQKDAYISIDFLEKELQIVKIKDAVKSNSNLSMVIKTNTGKDKMVVLFWSSEIYNKDNPDTDYFPVQE